MTGVNPSIHKCVAMGSKRRKYDKSDPMRVTLKKGSVRIRMSNFVARNQASVQVF